MQGLERGREDVVDVCVQTFVCGFCGNSAKKREAGFQGFRGSHCSLERKLCFSLHQPICTRVLRLPDSTLFPGIVVSVSDPVLLSLTPKILIFVWAIKRVSGLAEVGRVLRIKKKETKSCIHVTCSVSVFLNWCLEKLTGKVLVVVERQDRSLLLT